MKISQLHYNYVYKHCQPIKTYVGSYTTYWVYFKCQLYFSHRQNSDVWSGLLLWMADFLSYETYKLHSTKTGRQLRGSPKDYCVVNLCHICDFTVYLNWNTICGVTAWQIIIWFIMKGSPLQKEKHFKDDWYNKNLGLKQPCTTTSSASDIYHSWNLCIYFTKSFIRYDFVYLLV